VNRGWSGIGVACLVLVPGPLPTAQAQSLEEAVRTCAAEADDLYRLACYDRSVGPRVTGAHTAPSGVAPPPPATGAPAVDASRFGVRNGPLDERRHEDSGPKQITALVSGIELGRGGALIIALDNGQTWMQNEVASYFPLKVGDPVRIRAAALGSYMLFAPSKRATRVTRIH
jgi:hypothetical protein